MDRLSSSGGLISNFLALSGFVELFYGSQEAANDQADFFKKTKADNA
jgi:hypothetical protein